MARSFIEAVKNRRSIYALGRRDAVTQGEVEKAVHESILHVPSAFNSQSARIVVLWGKQSDSFWKAVGDVLKKIVPPESFGQTEAKLQSFAAGLGTILFFEDQEVVESLMTSYPLYQDNFPVWSLQSSGMLQFAVWTMLEDLGLGASLQHYNPLVDDFVHKEWNVPASWKLLAQMPFGSVEAPAGEKTFTPLEGRVLTFK